jgi:hypothetical protein
VPSLVGAEEHHDRRDDQDRHIDPDVDGAQGPCRLDVGDRRQDGDQRGERCGMPEQRGQERAGEHDADRDRDREVATADHPGLLLVGALGARRRPPGGAWIVALA